MKKEGESAVYAPGAKPLLLMAVIVVLGIIAGYSGRKKAEIEHDRLSLVWPELGQLSQGEQMALHRAAARCGLTASAQATTRTGVVACLEKGASVEDRETVEALLGRANVAATDDVAE